MPLRSLETSYRHFLFGFPLPSADYEQLFSFLRRSKRPTILLLTTLLFTDVSF